ncbi:hypothetical protein [Cryobacterium aureum]|uniref:hypothetical protein n=1 Tax=Cryobacterium aureum TaxID=995037 RepID=UPI00101ADB9B|nr:hypothetical protein [Cryobacterium aureum]
MAALSIVSRNTNPTLEKTTPRAVYRRPRPLALSPALSDFCDSIMPSRYPAPSECTSTARLKIRCGGALM